mmetsp:Transcript_78392/g.189229  ORF Transcript_78392/g.189229 Transcript_78392/m.189229 type:complete len:227 (+) Transcript_78392:3013-3693(+)
MARLGSGVITVRAEKSTRLPIRLPRMRPSLPLSRCEIDLSGRPVRVVAGSCPGMRLSMNVARWYWSSLASCSWMWLGAPFFSCSRSALLARMMSMSLTVRSSSPRPPVPSIRIDGRTWGGGTGSTVRIIQSGRAYCGLNPSFVQSSSLMALTIRCARSAVSSILRASCSSVDSFHSAAIVSPSRFMFGWLSEQLQQCFCVLATSMMPRNRCAGFFFLNAFISLRCT